MACPYKWYSTVVIIRRLTIALSEVQASDIPNEIPGFTKEKQTRWYAKTFDYRILWDNYLSWYFVAFLVKTEKWKSLIFFVEELNIRSSCETANSNSVTMWNQLVTWQFFCEFWHLIQLKLIPCLQHANCYWELWSKWFYGVPSVAKLHLDWPFVS